MANLFSKIFQNNQQLTTPKSVDGKASLEGQDVILEWKAPSVLKFKRSFAWYATIACLGAILLLLAFLLNSPTFATLIVVGAMVYALLTQEKATLLDLVMTEEGILYGSKYFKYDTVKNFWIERNPPYYLSVHFVFNSNFQSDITIHFQEISENDLRALLLATGVTEDTERELTMLEQIIKVLGL